MKVGIIGSGVVGQTLAAGFLKHGHQVEIEVIRSPTNAKRPSSKTGQRRIRAPQSNRSRKPQRSAILWSLRSEERLRSRR